MDIEKADSLSARCISLFRKGRNKEMRGEEKRSRNKKKKKPLEGGNEKPVATLNYATVAANESGHKRIGHIEELHLVDASTNADLDANPSQSQSPNSASMGMQ